MITWRGSPKKPNGFWNEKNSFHSADGLGSFFFEDPALLKNHNFLQWSQTSNVSWPKNLQNFSFSELFHHNRQEWRVTSGPSPPTMAWHRQKIFKKWGSPRSPGKMSTFPKSFYFISAEGKIVKNFLGKNIQDKLICLKQSLKYWSLKSLTISSSIYPKAQPSPSSVRTCTCLHNGAGHRSCHRLLQRFWEVWRSLVFDLWFFQWFHFPGVTFC